MWAGERCGLIYCFYILNLCCEPLFDLLPQAQHMLGEDLLLTLSVSDFFPGLKQVIKKKIKVKIISLPREDHRMDLSSLFPVTSCTYGGTWYTAGAQHVFGEHIYKVIFFFRKIVLLRYNWHIINCTI